MSSFKMHIAVSKKIQEELGLSDKFILGSILPDIYKLVIKDRKLTHYEVNINNKELPDIDKFIEVYKEHKSEIALGYLAHLIEDKIWFEEFIYKKFESLPDEKIYNDYSNIDKYIVEKYNLNMKEIKANMLKNVKDIKYNKVRKKDIKDTIEERIIDYPCYNKNIYFLEKDADKYFNLAYKKAKKIIEELI